MHSTSNGIKLWRFNDNLNEQYDIQISGMKNMHFISLTCKSYNAIGAVLHYDKTVQIVECLHNGKWICEEESKLENTQKNYLSSCYAGSTLKYVLLEHDCNTFSKCENNLYYSSTKSTKQVADILCPKKNQVPAQLLCSSDSVLIIKEEEIMQVLGNGDTQNTYRASDNKDISNKLLIISRFIDNKIQAGNLYKHISTIKKTITTSTFYSMNTKISLFNNTINIVKKIIQDIQIKHFNINDKMQPYYLLLDSYLPKNFKSEFEDWRFVEDTIFRASVSIDTEGYSQLIYQEFIAKQ